MSRGMFSRLLAIMMIFIVHRADARQFSGIRDPQFVGVRPLSMGETGVAVANDFNTIYWNPAGLPLVERYEVQFMRANLYQTGVKDNYLALMLPTLPFLHDPERLAFGFGWQNLSFGDDELDFAQHKFIFSTGYRLVKQLSLGGNLKYLYRSVTSDGTETEGQGKGWGFDFGVLLSPLRGLQLGAMIHDVTDTEIHDDFTNRSDVLFYRNIRYGAAYQLKDFLFLKEPLLAMDIDDRLHLGAEIWLQNLIALHAGVQKDLYENGEDEATLSFGMGLHYKFLQFDYAYTDSPFLQNTNRFSLSLHFDPPPSPVKIRNVEAHDLYASQFIHHQQSPWLEVELSYEGDKPIDCKLTVREKKYGLKAEKSFTLYPQIGATQKVFLNPQLSDKFLELPVTERNLARVTVSLAPKTVIATKADKLSDVEFTVYGVNNIYWGNGVGPAAAFILAEDEPIRQMAAVAQKWLHAQPDSTIINRNVSLSAYLFNLVGQYGVRYKPDASSPREELDTIQYPFELLRTKLGDCDDTTVLLASLLEHLDIRTALLDIPRHLLLMFDTGIHESRRLQLCLPEDQYVIYDQHIWLPVETTMYGEPFWQASRKGVEQYDLFDKKNNLKIVEVQKAWQEFPPTPLAYEASLLTLPSTASVAMVYNHDRTQYLQAKRLFLEQRYYKRLAENPNIPDLKNELATILFWQGEIERAEKMWGEMLGLKNNKD